MKEYNLPKFLCSLSSTCVGAKFRSDTWQNSSNSADHHASRVSNQDTNAIQPLNVIIIPRHS